MNFQSLKWMIDTLIKTYKCPECNSDVSESNVDIMWAAWSTVNIDIECTNCGKHSMIKTEVLAIDLTNKAFSAKNIEKLKKSLLLWSWKLVTNNKAIMDEEIIKLNNNLKQTKLNVSDLFWS